MEVLVVGAGSMGRWFAETVLAGADAVSGEVAVAFADADPGAARTAARAVGGRAVDLDGTDGFDAVCLAVPISAVADAAATQARRADRAVLDVTGAMAVAVAALREHAPDRERLSLHPLFAPANAPGTVAAVADAPGPTTDALGDALAAAGNDLVETTPEEHDRAMRTVQARAHAAVLSFALAAEEVPARFQTPVSRALWDVVVQVTGGSPQVYAEIQATFEGAEDVAAAARRVADADAEAFEALYREAGARTDAVESER